MPVINSTAFFAITESDIICGLIFAFSSIASVYTFHSAKKTKRQHALMSATPTSLVRDLKSGLAEVAGRVTAKTQMLTSPWRNRKCICFRFHVEEFQNTQYGVGNWHTYVDDMS